MSMNRPFHKGSYEAADGICRKAVEEKLRGWGWNIEANGEDYDVDIRANQPTDHELEARSCFEGDRFPFSTIHVPYRKNRLGKDARPFWYWSINNDASMAYVIQGSDVLSSPTEDKVINGVVERFYCVPKSLAKLVALPENTVEKIDFPH